MTTTPFDMVVLKDLRSVPLIGVTYAAVCLRKSEGLRYSSAECGRRSEKSLDEPVLFRRVGRHEVLA